MKKSNKTKKQIIFTAGIDTTQNSSKYEGIARDEILKRMPDFEKEIERKKKEIREIMTKR